MVNIWIYIPIHEVVNEIDPVVCKTLPVFYASIGCDTSFQHLEEEEKRQTGIHGKCFLMLAKHLKVSFLCTIANISQSSMSMLEQFVILYCMTAN